MSTFRAFQTGLEAGQKQAKVKREDDARMKAADAFKSGNFEGAVSSLMGVGLMDDANAYGQAGERKKEAEQTEAYASAFKTGLGAGPAPDRKAAYQAVGQAAGSRGDFGTMAEIDKAISQMDADQAEQFGQSMEFLGQTALGLKGVPPEARGQAAMEILKNSPYANPQILAQIQQAAADGRITDDELDNFAMQTMSVAERVKLAKGGETIRQVGNQIVERQPDGSWKSVYTGSNAQETARAFQGFIDKATGDQMVVMSDGQARSTGYQAYIPTQITSVGGVPTGVDKRTMETTALAPIDDVAGNKAAVASAEVQGKAQGQAAFDLPAIEMRAQTAINSIADLKRRDIGQRFGMQGKLYAIPGTDGANIQAVVAQVVSQAFLNAFDQLRGAGAITEVEGKAATAAITRLQDQNITVGEALKAMDELDAYYRRGVEVARARSVKAPVLPMRPESPAGMTPQAAQRPLPQAPVKTPWLTQQTQKVTDMAKPAATPAPATGLEGLSDAQLEALLQQMEGQ